MEHLFLVAMGQNLVKKLVATNVADDASFSEWGQAVASHWSGLLQFNTGIIDCIVHDLLFGMDHLSMVCLLQNIELHCLILTGTWGGLSSPK